MVIPQNLPHGQKPLVPVTHDESTFNSNYGKRQPWMKDGKQPLRPNDRAKGLMVSDFVTPGGRLAVLNTIADAELSARLLPCLCVVFDFLTRCPRGQQPFFLSYTLTRPQLTGSQTGAPLSPPPQSAMPVCNRVLCHGLWKGQVAHSVKAAVPDFNAAFLIVKLCFYSTMHPSIPLMLPIHFRLKT